MRYLAAAPFVLTCLLPTLSVAAAAEPTTAPATAPVRTPTAVFTGFTRSPYFDEQVRDLTFEPDVTIHINAPSPAQFRPSRPTRLILYALPNGNTIAQTIGRKVAEGVDWHYGIQHIGAQVRRLREVDEDENLIIAYLEASGRSWPAWRANHADANATIARLVDWLRGQVPVPTTVVDLTCHSGGGAFLFGFIESCDRIPDDIGRIAFLDANYSYSDEKGHADKLLAWLRARPDHHLIVLAYDDRDIRVDGKLVVGPTGGTFRRTQEMIERFGRDVTWSVTDCAPRRRYQALDGRIDFIVHLNPDNAILHTVMVGDWNGFIHALTSGAPLEGRAGDFTGPASYEKWIQPE